MSNTLTGGSIVWNLDVDDSKLKSGLDGARSSVESASKDIAKSSNTATSGIDKLKDSLNNAEGASKAFAGMIATVATGLAAATGFAIKSASDMENLRISLDVMTGSAENGEKVFKDLYDFAAKTPFETSDLAKATQTMLGFGISSEDVMGNLKMLGDVSMGNKDKLGSLTLAFSQITSTGRLMGQDLLQLINAGFNPLTIISQKTGKSMTELKDEMSKGAISAEMVTDAFKTATSEGGLFYQGMEKGSQTLSGTWSTLKDTLGTVARRIVGLSDTGEVIKGGLIDKLKDGVKLLTDTLEYFSTSEGIAKMENFLNTLKTLFPIITGAIIGGLIPAFYGWATAALAALVPLLPYIAIGALIGGAIFLIVKAVQALIPIFKDMVEWVKDAWGAIVNFFKTLPETISKIWTSIIDGIKSFFDGFVELITYWIPYAIGYVIGWFATLPERIGEALTNTWNNIKKWVTDTWNYLKVEIPKWITNIFNWFKELPGKIQSGLSNLGSTIKNIFTGAWENLKNEISQWPSRIWDWGKNIANSFVDGFKNALSSIGRAFTDGINSAKSAMKGNSPPKDGPLKEIDKWGSNIGQAWVDGFANSIGSIGTMFDSSMAQLQSLLSSPSFSIEGSSGGGNTQNVNISGITVQDKSDIDALIRQLGFKLTTI